MLRLVAAQAETLWDETLPIEVRELPDDLAALDELLSGPGLLEAFVEHWQREALLTGVSAADHGRPTLAIETYVRLMVLKHRYGYGYRSLVLSAAEIGDGGAAGDGHRGVGYERRSKPVRRPASRPRVGRGGRRWRSG